MKRKIASRKLKRNCISCNNSFIKGNVYYIKRTFLKEYGEIFAYEFIVCPRCKYETERSSIRKKDFIESGKCLHPIVDEIWRTMDGEDYVKEPSHTECLICKEHI